MSQEKSPTHEETIRELNDLAQRYSGDFRHDEETDLDILELTFGFEEGVQMWRDPSTGKLDRVRMYREPIGTGSHDETADQEVWAHVDRENAKLTFDEEALRRGERLALLLAAMSPDHRILPAFTHSDSGDWDGQS